MNVWFFVLANLTMHPMTEPQCKAIAGKVATVKGHRIAACVSPEGNWYPTPLGEISPRKTQVAQR